MTRRGALLVLLASLAVPALPSPSWAAAAADKEVYVKMTTIVVEFWDQAGLFHIVYIELSTVFKGEGKVDKLATERIQQALSALTWEEFSAGNPAATVKAVALDIIRKHKGGEKAVDVLMIKMMSR